MIKVREFLPEVSTSQDGADDEESLLEGYSLGVEEMSASCTSSMITPMPSLRLVAEILRHGMARVIAEDIGSREQSLDVALDEAILYFSVPNSVLSDTLMELNKC